MVLNGVLTNCNSGDLLAIASIIDMAGPEDRLHIRIYGQNGNTKYGLIKVLYNIIKHKREKLEKTTIPIEFSRYRGDYEKRYTDNCLTHTVYEESQNTNFIEVPANGFDKLYAFTELEELFSVQSSSVNRLRGDSLYLNGDYKNLKAKYLLSSDIHYSHVLSESNIKYLVSKFKKIYYFTNKMILGDYINSNLHQSGNYAKPLQEWCNRMCEGDHLFEFFFMVTKNDNLSALALKQNTGKNISTCIDIIPFAMVYLPTFGTLFKPSSFQGLDQVTLEPKFILDEDMVTEWYILNENENERNKILYNCLCGYFQSNNN